MPDLNDLYEQLGRTADDVIVAGPEFARRRGNRRRRNRLTAVAIAVVVIIAAATVGATQWRRLVEPARPTVNFIRLAPFGNGMPIPFQVRHPEEIVPDYAFVTIVGDRALVGHRDADRRVRIRAMDLATGNPAWTNDELGEWEEGPQIMPIAGMALVLVNNDSDKHQEHQVYAFDPATGALLWHTDDYPLLGSVVDGQLLGLGGGDTEELIALDARTGRRVWTRPLPEGNLLSWRPWKATSREVYGQTYDQILWWGDDGTVTAFATRDGATVRTWPGLLPRANYNSGQVTAIGDLIFKVHNGNPNYIDVLDRNRPGDGFRRFYDPVSNESFPEVTPCGNSQVCVATGRSGTDRAGNLALVDIGTGRVRWRASTADSHVGGYWFSDRILGAGGTLLDLNGRVLYQPTKPSSFSLVTLGSALVIDGGNTLGTGATPDPEVFGLSIADGHTVSLGHIPTLVGSCSNNTRVMVCVHRDGLKAYRFAA